MVVYSDAIHLNNRASYCLKKKNCLPDELSGLIYGLYRYIPEEENFEEEMIPEFKTRYDMIKAFYKLAEKTLKQKIYSIKSDIGTEEELIFVKTDKKTISETLNYYRDF